MFCYWADYVGDFFWIFCLMVNSSIRELVIHVISPILAVETRNYLKLVDLDSQSWTFDQLILLIDISGLYHEV